MNPIWYKVNAILKYIFISFGIIIVIFTTNWTYQELKLFEKLSEKTELFEHNISFSELFFNNQILITLSLLSLSSGIIFFFRKRVGWILGSSFLIFLIINLISFTLYGLNDVTTTYLGNKNLIYIILGIGLILSLLFLLIMFNKKVRTLNNINKLSIIYSLVIILALELIQKWI